MRKQFVLPFILLLYSFISSAQASVEIKLPSLDKSPMDMSYCPENYPMLKTQDKITQPPIARIIYSRPQKNNRTIFGGLVEYGKVWRLGANEATEIEFFRDVIIGSKKVLPGRYTLYAIPSPDHWTLIINKDTDIWGAFIYDSRKDILRIDEPVETSANPVEPFTINFTKTLTGANLTICWDEVRVTLPIIVKN